MTEETTGDAPIWLVALTASAGGLLPIRHILSALPSDLPAAVVVVLHRSPTRRGYLEAILRSHSSLPVVTAHAGDAIEAGKVYVARADSHLTVVQDGHFHYHDGTRIRFVHSSANPLLDSAAKLFGGRVIAVVLSGGGQDATDGVQAVKERGGRVIAQDPSTTEHRSMPQSAIRSGAVDLVLPVGEIAPAIESIVAGMPVMRGRLPVHG